MKTLLLIRHAKSSWDDITQKDFDRPLNERGKHDAPLMAKRLRKEKDVELDVIISSPAKRAIETSKYFAEEFDIKKKHVQQISNLYEPTIEAFFDSINNIDDDLKHVALVAHNPGITAFANLLTNARIDDMPTCSIFALKILNSKWKNFESAEKEFWFFDYPKNITAK